MTLPRITGGTHSSGLIVDDSPIIRTLLKRVLSSYCIECDEAKTGRNAIEQFEQRLQSQRPYDLLFLDVQMPEMDGYTALTHIRSIESRFPATAPVYVVVLTADESEETVVAMHSAGANAYCLKPFDRDSVSRHVETACRQKAVRLGTA